MKNFTKVISIALVIAMLAAFASCGSKNASASTKAPVSTTAAATVKVVDIALTDEKYAFGVSRKEADLQTQLNEFVKQINTDGTLKKIIDKYFGKGTPTPVTSAKEDKSKKQIVIATNAQFPPFEYTSGTNYLGIDMEIMKAFADKIGKELVIKNMKFEAVLNSVDAGYADIAAAGLTVSPDRKKVVNFSDSYYTASQMIIVKNGDTKFAACKTKEDVVKVLNGFDSSVKIGYQTGTTGQSYVKGSTDFGYKALKVTGKGYDSGTLAVQDMINGNLDCVIIDEAPAKTIVESFNALA